LLLMLDKLDTLYNSTLNDAIKDKLTETLNRLTLDDVLAIAESNYKSKNIDYTIVMIDVDNLKVLNDLKGHVTGDLLLIRLAACIKKSIRSADYVLRYGGDEFLILMQNMQNEKVEKVFRRIEGFLHKEYMVHNDFEVSFSRGYAHRAECDSTDSTVQIADKRMYEYKYRHRKEQ
jgi:diguanylate cyclase (GGDEF)-like protein